MMLRFRSLLVLSLLLIACDQEKSIPKETIELPKDTTVEVSKDILNLSDINLVIATQTPIDSVWIADIGQK
jgi:hypothetical protein